MAKCEKRQIKPEPPPVEYVLTLTADEARALLSFIESGGVWPKTPNDGYLLNGITHAIEVAR